jgi:prolyl oligopeptidase
VEVANMVKNARCRNKNKNVFDDFIAAAEYLIAQKYVVQLLAIRGGSNGGLLVGQP